MCAAKITEKRGNVEIHAEVTAQREGRRVFSLEQDEERQLWKGLLLAVSVPNLHSQLRGKAQISSLVDIN